MRCIGSLLPIRDLHDKIRLVLGVNSRNTKIKGTLGDVWYHDIVYTNVSGHPLQISGIILPERGEEYALESKGSYGYSNRVCATS